MSAAQRTNDLFRERRRCVMIPTFGGHPFLISIWAQNKISKFREFIVNQERGMV